MASRTDAAILLCANVMAITLCARPMKRTWFFRTGPSPPALRRAASVSAVVLAEGPSGTDSSRIAAREKLKQIIMFVHVVVFHDDTSFIS